MIKVMTGSHKQITGFVARFFSMTGLAAEHQAAVTVLEETVSILLFESRHRCQREDCDTSVTLSPLFFLYNIGFTISYVYTFIQI